MAVWWGKEGREKKKKKTKKERSRKQEIHSPGNKKEEKGGKKNHLAPIWYRRENGYYALAFESRSPHMNPPLNIESLIFRRWHPNLGFPKCIHFYLNGRLEILISGTHTKSWARSAECSPFHFLTSSFFSSFLNLTKNHSAATNASFHTTHLSCKCPKDFL